MRSNRRMSSNNFNPQKNYLQQAFGMDDIVPSFKMPLPSDEIFFIYGEIIEPLDYVDMIHSIRYAEHGQEITIHINSPGGDLGTGLAIINAIKGSVAEVTTVIDGEACSAAAMIWLAGHNKVIGSKHCYMMVHESSWIAGAKTSEHARTVEIMKKVISGLVDDLASGLFTPQEIEDVNKGMDIYLSGTEIAERVGFVKQSEQ